MAVVPERSDDDRCPAVLLGAGGEHGLH